MLKIRIFVRRLIMLCGQLSSFYGDNLWTKFQTNHKIVAKFQKGRELLPEKNIQFTQKRSKTQKSHFRTVFPWFCFENVF